MSKNKRTQNRPLSYHFKDGTSLNIDGSVHDKMNGTHILTNDEQIWLFENGWGK